MLFLNKADIFTLNRRLIQDAVEKAYSLILDNSYTMPDRVHVKDGENTLLLMPCFSGSYFATKLVSVFPHAAQKGLPVVNGIVVLNDNETGQPLALIDGAALTAERTGAVGGAGVSFLTRDNIQRAGIFGAGVQSQSQARYLLLNRAVREVAIMDLSSDAIQKMIDILAPEYPDVRFFEAESPEALVEQSELIIAATTTKIPLFENNPALVEGKTFISIGSFLPDMKEFPDAVIERADHVFLDTPFAAKESGDICQPVEQGKVSPEKMVPFAELVKSAVSLKDDSGKNKTLFFKSTGMALFDLTAASAVYDAAVAKKLGTRLMM